MAKTLQLYYDCTVIAQKTFKKQNLYFFLRYTMSIFGACSWVQFSISYRQQLFYKTLSQSEYNTDRLTTKMTHQVTQLQDSLPLACPLHNQVLSIKRIDIASAPQITAIFTPVSLELPATSHADSEQRTVRVTPLFNQDRLYFTPTFMLEEDQLRLQRNHQNLKLFHRLHVGKLDECESGEGVQEELLIPRPTANKYCHVCKGTYEDYLTHTRMPYHLTNIEQNKFWMDIGKLCTRFSPPTPKGKSAGSKQIKKRPAVSKRNKGKGDQLTNSDTLTSVQTKV